MNKIINPLMHTFTKWSHVIRYLNNKNYIILFSGSETTLYTLCIKGLIRLNLYD